MINNINQTVSLNEEEKVASEDLNKCLRWIKEHKKELIFSGLTIATIVGIILGLKKKEDLRKYFNSLVDRIDARTNEKTIEVVAMSINPIVEETENIIINETNETRYYSIPAKSITVKSHIRKLPEGNVHSLEKALEAKSLGIDLKPNETLVTSYTKYEIS